MEIQAILTVIIIRLREGYKKQNQQGWLQALRIKGVSSKKYSKYRDFIKTQAQHNELGLIKVFIVFDYELDID